MRIIRVLYLSSLVTILAGLGWLIYFFMTPISEANVLPRARTLCVIGNVVSQVNERFALTPLVAKRLDCACVPAKLRRQYGSAQAARLTDATRLLFVNSVRNTLTRRTDGTMAVGRDDLRSIQAFFRTIGRECPGQP